MPYTKNRIIQVLLLLLMTNAAFSDSAGPAEKGRDIIQKLLAADNGFSDFSANVTMTIHEKNGKQFVRHMEVKALEQADDGEKRLFIFDKPRDIRGTAVLSHTMEHRDSQWIYLPAFKRVKRISSSNKSSPFVASEFSYEDIASVSIGKYRYQYLKEAEVNGIACYVVRMEPQFDGSGYQYQVAYVDKQEYIFRKIDYYDTRKKLIKTLQLTEYKKYKNRFWRPLALMMVNHQNGRLTNMHWNDVVYQNGFNENDFGVYSLKRRR